MPARILLRLLFMLALLAPAWAGAAVLYSISPALGDVHGGVQVTLRGLRLSGAGAVSIGGVACTDVVVVNDRVVTCVSPALPAGLHTVSITSPRGTAAIPAAYESWSPAALPGARLYQADQGLVAAGSTAGSWHPWTRTTALIHPSFRPRDGAQLLYNQGALYLLGGIGATPGVFGGQDSTNEVWKSINGGVTWRLVLPHDDRVHWQTGHRWRRRHMQAVTVHKGLLYVIGGDHADADTTARGWPTFPTDVWSSPDGVKWTCCTRTAEWGPRVLHMCASFQGKLYVMGGQRQTFDASTALNDVWESSDDGATWTRVTADAGWAPRGMVTSPVEFQGHLYLAGGGTYTDSVPRKFYNDVWRWDGSGPWEQVAETTAWQGREYHNVVAYDEKLWVLGGYNSTSGNMRDVWSSPDGVVWTQNHDTPWDESHADGVAVGDGRLYHGPGNGSMLRPWRRDFWYLTPRPAMAVSEWRDLGAGGRHLRQPDAAKRPLLVGHLFGRQPGVDFMGVHHLVLDEVDRGHPGGFQIYFVGKTRHVDNASDVEAINPPSTLVGNTTSEAYNEFGLRGGVLRYHDGSKGWIKMERAALANDGRCRLLWAQHSAGSLRLGAGGYPRGAVDARAGFSDLYTGWNCLGAGYGGADAGRFSIGALVVVPGAAISSAQLKKLSLWAQKWGSVSP